MKTLRLTILAGVAAAVCSATPLLTLLPGSTISGAPGSTIGWGYSITNDSSTDWLQPLGLSATGLSSLNPLAIFDYPAIAPSQTVTELFSTTALTAGCTALPCGLFEITIPSGVAPKTVTGTFTILADYFNGNPNTTGVDVGSIGSSGFSASDTVNITASSGVPEPGTLALLVVGFGALLVRRRAA